MRARVLLKPKWLLFHVAAVVFVVAFVWLGWWQLGRGEAGNARSYGYALEWPVFAGFTVFFWYRTIREELRAEATTQAAPPEPTPEERAVFAQRVAEEPDEAMDAYNEYLAWLAANPKRG